MEIREKPAEQGKREPRSMGARRRFRCVTLRVTLKGRSRVTTWGSSDAEDTTGKASTRRCGRIVRRRRLSTICGFFTYCAEERLIERNPAAHVRRPKQNYESSTLGLDRNELGGFLVEAGLCGGRDHALACLLALNGLRISEALGADIDDLDHNRGHRTLFIHRKGGKTATIPLAPRTARALDLYIAERASRPDLHEPRHDPTPRPPRRQPHRQAAREGRRDRQADLTALVAAQLHHRRARRRRPTPRRPTPTREPRCATTEDEAASTVMPPTSSPPSSPAPAAELNPAISSTPNRAPLPGYERDEDAPDGR